MPFTFAKAPPSQKPVKAKVDIVHKLAAIIDPWAFSYNIQDYEILTEAAKHRVNVARAIALTKARECLIECDNHHRRVSFARKMK